jgi:hypothetical protein
MNSNDDAAARVWLAALRARYNTDAMPVSVFAKELETEIAWRQHQEGENRRRALSHQHS